MLSLGFGFFKNLFYKTGAVGFGLAVLAMGSLIEKTGSFKMMFVVHIVGMLLSMVLVRVLLKLGPRKKEDENGASKNDESSEGGGGGIEDKNHVSEQDDAVGGTSTSGDEPYTSTSQLGLLKYLLKDWSRCRFFFVVLVSGSFTGVIENFLFLFLEQELEASKTLIGLSRFVTCACEVPMFWIAGTMMKRMGTSGVLCFACFCYTARFLSYASLYNPQHVLWIEPLHGITYAVMWSTSCNFAHQIAVSEGNVQTCSLLLRYPDRIPHVCTRTYVPKVCNVWVDNCLSSGLNFIYKF